ncbi:putative Ig domain-containing protein [Pseudoscardovia radai]|uniref:putative Ig domain-containing protein n=1 Tax=Pseudoscardovia radai TaxID=987066 RepID=UPI00399669D1
METTRKRVVSRTVGAFVAAVVSCSAGVMALPAYADGTDTATPVQVATVADLNSAISGLTAAGTVQLTGDLTCADDGTFCITVAKGKTVTIDLNGHSITKASATPTDPNGYVIDNGGALTITNSADAKSTISQENGASSAIRNLGTLTLDSDNVTYASNDITIKNDENGKDKLIGTDGTEKGTLVVNGGTFTRVNEKGAATTQDIQNWSEATVNGGTFNNQLVTWASDYSTVSKAGTLTVTNGTFKGIVSFYCYSACTTDESTPKATISGGTFQELTDSAANNKYAFSTVAGGKHADVSISDGTFAVAPNAAFIVSGKTYAKNDDGTYSVVADVAPEITTTALAAATVGASYTATLEATGTPTPTLSVAGLPDGLAFDASANTISGTPTAGGASTVTVTATNAAGTVSKDLTLTVNQAAAISTTALDSAVVGTEYTAQIAVTGTPAPTVTVTGLPAGLAFDNKTNTISGTPTTAGTSTVTVEATNGIGETATATLTLTVNATAAITTTALDAATINTPYTAAITATGAPAPTVTVTGLPAGLAFDNKTNTISGTPTESGSFDVAVKASNGIGEDATATLKLVVNEAPTVSVAKDATTLVNTTFSTAVTTTGFPAPTVTVDGLPEGLAYDAESGAITGTPTKSGVFDVTVKASNGIGEDATATLKLTVNEAPALTVAATDSATINTAYSTAVTATGFPAPTVTVAGLPDGLAYDAESGAITGTPTKSGVFDVTVKATNGIGDDATATLKLTVGDPATISTTGLADATVGTEYTATIETAGFPAPTVTVDGLPDGLAFDAATGAISGTPAKSGVFDVTVKATNGFGEDATATLKLTVFGAPYVTTTALADATKGTEYTAQIAVMGAPAPSVAVYGLPAGLAYDAETGAVSGTPLAVGTYNVVVLVSNKYGNAAATLPLTVTGGTAPVIATDSLPDATSNVAYSAPIKVTGDPDATLAVYGLPAGLAYDAESGAIAGTTVAAGTYDVVIVATNGVEPNAVRNLKLTVSVGTVSVYRVYNPNTGEHVYTTNAAEKDALVALGWADEGAVWSADTYSATAVYRVYNPNTGEHFYTEDSAEKDALVTLGWADEGVAWYASAEKTESPIYRVYNPNTGEHVFTADSNEKDSLVKVGWNDEGIAFYGVDTTK